MQLLNDTYLQMKLKYACAPDNKNLTTIKA